MFFILKILYILPKILWLLFLQKILDRINRIDRIFIAYGGRYDEYSKLILPPCGKTLWSAFFTIDRCDVCFLS
jgi:hypothetical protein